MSEEDFYLRSRYDYPDDPPPAGSVEVGRVKNYFPRPRVVAVVLEPGQGLRKGDRISIGKPNRGWKTVVISSMQFDHETVTDTLSKGLEAVAIKTNTPIKNGDKVFLHPALSSHREGSFVK